MKITNIKIKTVTPNKGHLGFCSFVIDDWLFLNNIAIFSRLNEPEKIRLVFPEKKIGEIKISLFHPLKPESYFLLEEKILAKMKEL